MRKLLIKLILFVGLLEGLRHVDFMVLLAATGAALAAVICADLLLDSASPR